MIYIAVTLLYTKVHIPPIAVSEDYVNDDVNATTLTTITIITTTPTTIYSTIIDTREYIFFKEKTNRI